MLKAMPVSTRAVGAGLRCSAATILEPLPQPSTVWARAPNPSHGRTINVRAISVNVSADSGGAGSGSTPTLPNATADARRMASTSAGPSVGPSAGPSAGGRAAAGRGMASVTGTTAPAGAAGPGNMSKEEWAEHWRMAIRRFRQEEAALEARGGGSGAEKGRR